MALVSRQMHAPMTSSACRPAPTGSLISTPFLARGRRSVLPARAQPERGPTGLKDEASAFSANGQPGATPPFGPTQPNPPKVDALPDNKATAPLKDALSWYGPAPETINGRLAMLGFVAAMGAELANGTPLWDQIAQAKWPVFATIITFIVASLVPIFRGAKLNVDVGIWRKEAELINGRAAMIGLVALLLTEVIRGGALFSPFNTPLEGPINATKANVERTVEGTPAIKQGIESAKDTAESLRRSPYT